MLQHLTIRNFALIEHDEIDFDKGITVLTGETGAGKSILIDALSLVLGSRADSRLIRHGADRCDISAEFNIEHLSHVTHWLEEHELRHHQDCLLRRIISNDGKSRAFINGQPVTLLQLNDLGQYLVDIHGQHEHHFLLKRDHQLLLLDEFGQYPELLENLKTLYSQWQALEKQHEHFHQLHQNQTQKDFVQFQLQELQALNLQTNEITTLETEFKTLNQAEDILQRCQNAINLLTENEINIGGLLQQSQQQLIPIESIHEHIANASKNIVQADMLVHESAHDLRQYLAHFDTSPERLAEISNRLDHIHQIARKHRIKPEGLLALLDQLQKQYKDLVHASEALVEIENQQQAIVQQYQKAAQELSEKRANAAKRLSKAVTAEMQKLSMIAGKFEIQFQPFLEGIHPKGQERCEFWVKPNPGHPAQPLAKIASGGELSRISLAIQVILASHAVVPTLIFDEVDVGIGGATASIVGQLLKTLSQHTQVLCVTHLPQVAAFGDQHYKVKKSIAHQQTIMCLDKLVKKSRQEEIARMLSGIAITPQSLAHAKELLSQAQA